LSFASVPQTLHDVLVLLFAVAVGVKAPLAELHFVAVATATCCRHIDTEAL